MNEQESRVSPELLKEIEELREQHKQAQGVAYERGAEFNPLEQGVRKVSEESEHREVLARVQLLFNVLDTLSTSINILSERLQPVLNPKIYQADGEGEDVRAKDEAQSPVAQELYALIDRVNTQERLVRDLIRNLEI